MSSYKEPEWAVRPTSSSSSPPHPPWTLTEIKAGIEVARHDLSLRATTILGRAAEAVHVPLRHESVSRQHARIAFDEGGNAWLRDLRSAHGTFVNRRRLPPEACGKTESDANARHPGARGVRVFEGDVLEFGASSRYFALEGGPPRSSRMSSSSSRSEGSREEKLQGTNDRWQQQEQQEQQHHGARDRSLSNRANDGNKSASREGGISWGISMDDDCSDGGEESHDPRATGERTLSSLPEDPSEIPEKHRREFDKLNAMKHKLKNLETEDLRIRRKGGRGEDGSLTEGQERQLQRNAEKEASLRASIREREERLCDKLSGSGSSKSKRHSAREIRDDDDDDDDDDFFDRTKRQTRTPAGAGGVGEDAESEETLTRKWKRARGERRHLETVVVSEATNRAEALRDRVRALGETTGGGGGDEAEAFFAKNDLALALEARSKAESALAANAATMERIEALLRVVNPKLRWDRETGYVGEGRPPPPPPPAPPAPPTRSAPPDSGSTSIPRSGDNPSPDKIPCTTESEPSSTSMQPPRPMLPPPNKTTAVEFDAGAMPPPPPPPRPSVVRTKPAGAPASASEAAATEPCVLPPPPNKPNRNHKRKRVMGPAAMPPPAETPSRQPPGTTTKRERKTRIVGTLAFLNPSAAAGASEPSETKARDAKKNERIHGDPSAGSNGSRQQRQQQQQQQQLIMGSASDVWRAPQGQDGSGRTKLNDKFAGRY